MKAPGLNTNQPKTKLIEPDVERDAPKGVEWLSGESGSQTLAYMGVHDIRRPSLNVEKQRVHDFIVKPGQLNWMIEHEGEVVGSIWVDLQPTDGVDAPALHIMIGDPSARGKGIGHASTEAVLSYLQDRGHELVYSRHLVSNFAAASLLGSFNFIPDGSEYKDKDGLEWQNAKLVQKPKQT